MSHSLRPHGLCSPWHSPGQNTGVGVLSLLQGIFPTQGSNPGLPRCRWILYRLSHQGSLPGTCSLTEKIRCPSCKGVWKRGISPPAGKKTTEVFQKEIFLLDSNMNEEERVYLSLIMKYFQMRFEQFESIIDSLTVLLSSVT